MFEPTDRAVTALIKDLKHRGLLEETLIVWGGEFGRTPFREGRTAASAVHPADGAALNRGRPARLP